MQNSSWEENYDTHKTTCPFRSKRDGFAGQEREACLIMKMKNFLAFDLGAESGRAVTGRFDGKLLTLDEVHRFGNEPVYVGNHMYWKVLSIFTEICNGIRRVLDKYGELSSIGLDTWGVDFALLDKNGELIGNPHHYRDHRTDGVMEKVFKQISKQEIFDATGVQFMQLNTLYQLYSMVLKNDPSLKIADKLLMMPDLFNYWLTGEKLSEYTIATTTQCYDTRKNEWAKEVIKKINLPGHILPGIILPATEIGTLTGEAVQTPRAAGIKVIAPACHDTGSAIAAVPANTDDYAYISSGTWSLMGVVSGTPVVTPLTLEYDFTNEGGVDNTICLLKNITGLWVVQECRKEWISSGEKSDYDILTTLAERAKPFQAFINPDHPSFLHPASMTQAIKDFCVSTGQPVPEERGTFLRVTLESLACKYRQTLEQLEKITCRRIATIHIVGGGSRNRFLNRLTADACARPVYAGPVEATAIGNILAQMIAQGDCSSWAQARDLVRTAFPLEVYEPRDKAVWNDAYKRYLAISK
jgi:rhamnulokinase